MIYKLIEEIGFTSEMMGNKVKEVTLSPELYLQFVNELSKIFGKNLSGVGKFKGMQIKEDKELKLSFKIEMDKS
jgi:hypothetical protein